MNKWIPFLNKQNFEMPVDAFARREHFIDHIAPVWNELEQHGFFYVPESLIPRAESWGCKDLIGIPGNPETIRAPGSSPILASSQGDLIQATRQNGRPLILMEHGVGLVFPGFGGYAGGLGMRRYVGLFLPPNEVIYRKTQTTFPDANQVVIGTPKLDSWANYQPTAPKEKPTIAISFHWDGRNVAPEAGNAFEHYKDHLQNLTTHYHVLGHGHPRIMDALIPLWNKLGFEIVRDFRDVMARADMYINDCSSTMYEFLVTGKPVVILNSPRFSRKVNYGIRFWDFTDIGPQVNNPKDLLPTIDSLFIQDAYKEARKKTASILYPYLGNSAKRAAEQIAIFCKR